MGKKDRRFHRQFEAISRLVPALSGPIKALRTDKPIYPRLPLALLMIAGGFVSGHAAATAFSGAAGSTETTPKAPARPPIRPRPPLTRRTR